MSFTRNPDDHEEDVRYIGGLLKRVSNFQPESFKSNFQERKRFQKTVYLIQAFGINLGFKFNWYIHGPYCPDLADIGYSLADRYDEISERRFADEEYEQRFARFLKFIDPYREETEKLEISASLHYLWDHNQEAPKDMLIEYLLSEKDVEADFEECEDVWNRLEEQDAIVTN